MDLKPLGDRVVVEFEESDDRTAGGIFIPDNAKEEVRFGRVIAVGPGRRTAQGVRIPVEVNVGYRVWVSKLRGTEIPGTNGRRHVIDEARIYVVLGAD